MAGQRGRPDPKEAALSAARCLNPHPDKVTDPEFLSSEFFDARDAVQVKYEMVRKVKADGGPVTETAAAFGYSRPSYYRQPPRWNAPGWKGWCRPGPGPAAPTSSPRRSAPGPRSSWPPVPALRPAQLAGPIEESFGVRVHPRSVERALARRRERHSKSR